MSLPPDWAYILDLLSKKGGKNRVKVDNIYYALKKRSRDISPYFKLILFLDQTYEVFKENVKSQGLCYGYSEYWRIKWLPKYLNNEILPSPKIIVVQFLQKIQPSFIIPLIMETYNNIQDLVSKFCRMITRCYNQNQLVEFVMFRTKTSNTSHNIRIYCDKDYHLHYFDANVGWYKSNIPRPSIGILKEFIGELFKYLDYKYKCIEIRKIYWKI